MPQNSAIESVSIDYNDDGTLTIRARPKDPETKGGQSHTFMESKTLTAINVDDALKKVKDLFALPAPKKGSNKNPLDTFFDKKRMTTVEEE